MKKILFFIFDDMTDYEITLLMHLLHADAGMEISLVAYEKKEIKGKSGAVYMPHMALKDIHDEDVMGLVICGGWYGEIRDELKGLILKLNSENKLLAGICGAGTYILGKTGALDCKHYTRPMADWTEKHQSLFGETCPFDKDMYLDSKVVRDGNVITAIGEAFVDFAVEVCDWYKLFETEEEKSDFSKLMKGDL